jgi:hypothetical protein
VAKYSDKFVAQVRSAIDKTDLTVYEIAEIFHITSGIVYRILRPTRERVVSCSICGKGFRKIRYRQKICYRSVCNDIHNRMLRNVRYYRTQYSMTDEQLQIALNKKSAIVHCAICGKRIQGKQIHIDHDHSTGLVRGFLCFKHNTGLGLFDDDPALLQRAVEYLAN